MRTLPRIISCLLLCLSFGLLVLQAGTVAGNASAAQGQGPLQFTSGSHLLGFGSGYFYMAGLDHRVQISFDRALPVQPVAHGVRQSAGTVAPLQKVSYVNLWDKIDVEYCAVPGGIAESTYTVHPGGNPREISLNYDTQVGIRGNGALQAKCGNGVLEESRPVAWQETDGCRSEVAVAYRQTGERQIGFQLGSYDAGRTLYIDPTYSWHTYYGSSDHDGAYGIATDTSSNVYIVGGSMAAWDGPTGQAPRNAFVAGGEGNLFVLKLNSTGDYQWHAFFGPASPQDRFAIALDGQGNIYIGGFSTLYWNGPTGQAPLNAPNPPGASDFFVLKLDNAGNYLWHTFYGCTHYDPFYALAVDSQSNVIVAANSRLPWTGPAGQEPKHPHSFIPSLGIPGDFAILKLNSEGAYQWHTFYGSLYRDDPGGLAVDADGNIYMAGLSEGSWTAPAAPLQPYIGGQSTRNMAVLKLSGAGAYLWHTFYGAGQQSGNAIALDTDNNIYAVGNCGSAWTGPDGQAPRHAITGLFDMAILKLNSSGSYLWHTYYGGNADDSPRAVATGPCGIFVAGYSRGPWAGPSGQQPLNNYTAGYDWAIVNVGSGGDYGWHSFYGSSETDTAEGISLRSNNLYVAGSAGGAWAGGGVGQPKNGYHGLTDAAILRLSGALAPIISSFSPAVGGPGTEVIITGCAFAGATSVKFGGIPAASFVVLSDTAIRAWTGMGATGRITVTTAGGQAVSATDFVFPVVQETENVLIGAGPGSSGGYASAPVTQQAVQLPNAQVQSASLSSTTAVPGSPVTVTARVVNPGSADGTARVTLYVNGQQESSQSVKVAAAGSVPVNFTVSRDEPGVYAVRVGTVPAGSFTVSGTAEADIVLFVSAALVLIALTAGAAHLARRRQPSAGL